MARTLFDKLWDQHVIKSMNMHNSDVADLIAIDRVFLHERTGGVALKSIAEAGRSILAPERVFAFMDHVVSFREGREPNEARSPAGENFIIETREMVQKFDISLIDTNDARQGIVHVVTPELGLALPGHSIVCPDSHTCSLGALGALAIGVGSSDVEHAMVTGALRRRKPQQIRVRIEGELSSGVYAKDVALYLIANHGARGAKGRVVEFCGSTIEAMDMEARLTLCNMGVEFGAFTALIAPDEKTIDFIQGKAFSPSGKYWKNALENWKHLSTDDDASFDQEIIIAAADIRPRVTWGTSPEQGDDLEPKETCENTGFVSRNHQSDAALSYMGLMPSDTVHGLKIDGAFIGSCTNGRLSDLRVAAQVLKGKHVAKGVRAVCVPGSQHVRKMAEEEGLDKIFKAAGFEWGAPGCAMCFYAGGETFPPGARVVSSTNRNFEGRQGPGVRTHLASPATVAASAVAGCIIAEKDLILLEGAA